MTPDASRPVPGRLDPDRPDLDHPVDVPDPEFWGPEPHQVRRFRRGRTRPGSRPVEPPNPGGWSQSFAGLGSGWFEGLRDRLRDSRMEVGLGVVAVVVVALIAGVFWYRMAAGGSAPPAREPVSTAAPTSGPSIDRSGRPTDPVGRRNPSTRTSGGGATLLVHVAGAVKTPGVLEFPNGARVIDAVEGAGGGLADADLDRLNLAAKLADGQRVLVPKVGAAPVSDPASAADPGNAVLVDLNNATSAQLEALPGIGPSLAAAIIGERERRGGFRSVNELREVRGIGEQRFADVRDLVMV